MAHFLSLPRILTNYLASAAMRRAITQLLALLAVLSLAGVQAQMLGALGSPFYRSKCLKKMPRHRFRPVGQPCAHLGTPARFCCPLEHLSSAWMVRTHRRCLGAGGRPLKKGWPGFAASYRLPPPPALLRPRNLPPPHTSLRSRRFQQGGRCGER